MRKLWRRFKTLLLAAVVAGISTAIWPPDRVSFFLLPPLHRLEWLAYDALFVAQGPKPDRLDPRIVVIGYDTSAEKALGAPWPPPRKIHAQVIRNLKAAGAQLIVYDVLFSAPADPADDKALDSALKLPGTTILACRLDRNTVQKQISLDAPYYDDALGIDFEANARIGFAEIAVEEDGVVRAIAPTMKFQDEWLPSLAAAALIELRTPKASPHIRPDGVQVGTTLVPNSGPSRIDPIYETKIPSAYVGFASGVRAFSGPITFDAVYRNEIPPNSLKGKIVFVGVSGVDMAKQANDSYVTAYSHLAPESAGGANLNTIPGVIVQAHLLNAMLTNSFIEPAPAWIRFGTTFVFSLIGIGLSRRYLNWRAPLFLLLAMVSLLATSIMLFTTSQAHLPYAVPTLTLFLVATLTAYVERGALKKRWSGYVSPDVLDQILKSEEGETQSRRYRASIVFGDIRGFTSFSDQHDAELVIRLLNAHFERLTEIIYAERGTIDKFLGDGILVVFGAPVRTKDAALRAVRASIKMREAALVPLELDGQTYNFDTGFGITTGEFVAGHVGSRRRHDFSVIGDVVNVASRLQGVTGQPDVIVDETTFAEIEEHVEAFEPLGEVALKGKPIPVKCFKILALKSR